MSINSLTGRPTNLDPTADPKTDLKLSSSCSQLRLEGSSIYTGTRREICPEPLQAYLLNLVSLWILKILVIWLQPLLTVLWEEAFLASNLLKDTSMAELQR